MNHMCSTVRGLVVGATLALSLMIAVPCEAQKTVIERSAGVDNTNMGAYRALAELSFQAFQKGDREMAAKLAKILERTWDRGEEIGGPQSLGSQNRNLFEQIDQSMDDFIKPLLHYATKAPTADVVEPAYKAFLDALKKVDEQPK
jgi:hypothetical protein